MRAAQVASFGTADVLRVAELPDPDLTPDSVLIDVSYSAVGLVDIIVRKGGIPFPLPFVPGLSISGHVRAVGATVNGVEVGARVAAFTAPPGFGGYASVVAVPAALVASLDTPTGPVSMETGAALIVNGPTALLALCHLGALHDGTAVVVTGATGALGSVAAQVARQFGARPLIAAIGSPRKREAALAMGYSHVLVTGDDLVAQVRELTDGRGAGIVIDPVGGPLRAAGLAMLRPLGRLIAVGHASDEADAPTSPTDLWLGNQAILGLNIGALAGADPQRFANAARTTIDLAARGALRVDIDRTYALEEVAEAHRRLESRLATGVVLLRVG
jgi:NADPH2:quinone reductase